jgi:hypothetical protein
MRRRPAGVERLVTSVSRDNPAALRMLRRLGPTTVEDSRTAAVEVVVELDPDGAG